MTHPQEVSPVVTVSDDASEIARVVAEATEHDRTRLDAALADLDRTVWYTPLVSLMPRASTEQRQRLRDIATGAHTGSSPDARARAIALLDVVEPAAARRALAAVLSDSDPLPCRGALKELPHGLAWMRGWNPATRTALFDDPAVSDAMDAILERGNDAVSQARVLSVRLDQHPLFAVSERTLAALAHSLETLDERSLYPVASVLEKLVRRGRGPEAEAAARLILRDAAARPSLNLRQRVAIGVAAPLMGRVDPAALEPFLAARESSVVTDVLIALIPSRGASAIETLLDRLGQISDTHEFEAAVMAVGRALRGSEDAAVVQRLLDASTAMGDRSESRRAALALALADLGGTRAREEAMARLSRLTGIYRTHVRSALAGTTASDAIAWAVEAGIVPATAARHALSQENGRSFRSGAGAAWDLALSPQGSFLFFDCETCEVVSRHDALVWEMATASRGRFSPDAALQTTVGEAVPGAPVYRLEVVSRGRLFTVMCRNHGDWYDTSSVFALVHRALAEAGVDERFVRIDTGDQMCVCFLGHPEAIATFCERTGLEMAPFWH